MNYVYKKGYNIITFTNLASFDNCLKLNNLLILSNEPTEFSSISGAPQFGWQSYVILLNHVTEFHVMPIFDDRCRGTATDSPSRSPTHQPVMLADTCARLVTRKGPRRPVLV